MKSIWAMALTASAFIAAAPASAQQPPNAGYGSGDVTVHPRRLPPRPRESWNDGSYSNIWREGAYYPNGYNYGEVYGSPGARPANGNGAFPMLPSQPVYAPSDQGFPMRGMGGSLLHSF